MLPLLGPFLFCLGSKKHFNPGEVGSHRLCPQEVVAVIDAYDIALFMSARLLGRSLRDSATPLVFCGEITSFPNQAYAYLYPSQEGKRNRFLNAGCFFGPVSYVLGAIEGLLVENSVQDQTGMSSIEKSVVLADDQYEWARYAIVLITNHRLSSDPNRYQCH